MSQTHYVSSSKARLLCSVSVMALGVVLGGTTPVFADTGTWTLELDGQYDFDASGASESFVPSAGLPDTRVTPTNGFEAGGRIAFQPSASPFSYALALRHGRSRNTHPSFNDTHPAPFSTYIQDVHEENYVSHTAIDFEVGKDVGIGLFGTGTTTIGAGLRYAHFDAITRGNFSTSSKYTTRAGGFKLSRYSNLIGPRVFARTSSPFAGELGRQGFSLGLGAGAGILYGRQTAKNDETLAIGSAGQFPSFSRSSNVAAKTVDASAELGWAVPGTPLKVAAGYRYDAAYRALDGGFADSNQINSVQHGPFLSLELKLN